MKSISAKSSALMFFRKLPVSLALVFWSVPTLMGQAPPVPPEYQDLYTSLNNYLVSFNSTLGPGSAGPPPTLMTGSLKAANSNVGPQLLNGMNGVQLQLNALKAMGSQAIMVQVGFPMLDEAFLTSQGQSFTDFQNFYQSVANAVRSAGLKLVVENDTLLSSNVSASGGWDATSFYATLDWADYQQARAQTAAVIAQTMQPDYMVVLEEPDTEAGNTHQPNVNTPRGATAMLGQILTSVHAAGVPNLKLGAGVGTWTSGYTGFIQNFLTVPVDFIDFHIYPVNRNFLPNAVQIANIAALAGKPVSITECWLSKQRDSELGVLTADQVRARNPFSFWAPLDQYFIQSMQSLASKAQMVFLTPYSAEYYFAYQDYDDTTENLTPEEILGQENSLVSAANQNAQYTTTGMSYYHSIVVPADVVAPSIPGGFSGGSANPTSAYLNWTAATDNVGTAGYQVMRNGTVVGTTGGLYYQDTGLTESTAYTYSIAAYDLGGNVSVAAPGISITTRDVTPPSPPAGLGGTAVSCQEIKLTWAPSTDNSAVANYLVFWGLSPASLIQVGRISGSSNSYTSYPLTCGTNYYYGLEAADKAGNISLMSAIVEVTTPVPPAPPAGLSATPLSIAKVGLSWTAAVSGGLPVVSYHVLRGTSTSSLSQIGATGQTSYTDKTANATTTYYYAIQAIDTGGDLSDTSAVLPVTTPSLPSPPAGLVATPKSSTVISLNWLPAAGAGLPIQSYHVYRGTTSSNLAQLAMVSQPSYRDASVTAGTTYYYAIAAADTGGDVSPMSALVQVTAPSFPAAPDGLVATPKSSSVISLDWSAAASGGLPIQNYHVFRGTTPSSVAQLVMVSQTTYRDTNATAGTTYYYGVTAADSGGDLSPMSALVQVTAPMAPSAPDDLVATPKSSSVISLSWSVAASGGLPIQNYRIYRGVTSSSLVQLVMVSQTSYRDATVVAGTTYYYAVAAADTGGDLSPMSPAIQVAAPAAPSAPTGLVATPISTTKISLVWSAALSGGLPIKNYVIFRGTSASTLNQVATVAQCAYTDNSGVAGTTYYYAVEAVDTGGDVSTMSASIAVTTLVLPSAPTNLTATAVSKSQVNLSWTAAQSGMPLKWYSIYQGSSPESLVLLKQFSAVNTTFTNGKLTAATTYYYAVQATDTGGNVSPLSDVVAVTTPD